MGAVLVTGVSGVGKSTVLAELERRAYKVVDTDYGGWITQTPLPNRPGSEPLWREDRMHALLAQQSCGPLFVAGCVANQGAFYARFDAIVLLSAPLEVILERVCSRDTNDFGKSDAEREKIVCDVMAVEPLLRMGATMEIDTRRPLDELADELESVGLRTG